MAILASWRRRGRAALRSLLTPTPVGIDFGDLRRVTPISRHWGYDRGNPVDRYYIERFLGRNARHVRGRVLEVGDSAYTWRFGGKRVQRSDVLHVVEGHPDATIVANLAYADHIPTNSFDCIILTQTLHLIFEVEPAMRTLHRILSPGGVLLLTVPGISQTTDDEWRESWFWSFTRASLGRLAGMVFGEDSYEVESSGNVLAATAFLYGLAMEELRRHELDVNDPDYPVTITLRAVKLRPPGSVGL
jgi:SAM-dependent methyltransferase